MNKTILLISLLAIAWHLSIIVISRLVRTSRKQFSLKRLLRLIELDLLQTLHERADSFSKNELENFPYRSKLEEVEYWFKRVKKYYE